jgi:hypothetical protein
MLVVLLLSVVFLGSYVLGYKHAQVAGRESRWHEVSRKFNLSDFEVKFKDE